MFSNFTGPDIPLPTPYEIYNTYLKDEAAYVKKYIDKQRNMEAVWMHHNVWRLDGTDTINVMVFSAGKTVFLKSVEASDEIKNYAYIYKVLSAVVKQVGD